MLLVTAAALLVLVRRHVLAWAMVATLAVLAAAVVALRGGLHIALAGPLFTLWIAALYQVIQNVRMRRRAGGSANIPHAE